MDEELRQKIVVDTKDAVKPLEELADKYDETADKVDDAVTRIKSAFSNVKKVVTDFTSAARDAFTSARDNVTGFMDGFKDGLEESRDNADAAGKALQESFDNATERAAQATEAVDAMKRKLLEVKAAAAEAKLNYDNINENVQEVGLGKWQDALTAYKKAEAQIPKVEKQIELLKDIEREAAAEAKEAGDALNEATAAAGKAASNRGFGRLESVLSSTGKLFQALASRAAGAARAVSSHFAARLGDATTGSMKLSTAIDRLSAAFGGIGRQAVRMVQRLAIRAVLDNIGEAMGALARECGTFNGSMSTLGSKAQQLAAQIVAAFAPLVNFITPALAALEEKAIAAMTRVSEFTASLVGQDHYEVALPVDYDYAKAMTDGANATDKQTKATKKATQAQKEYNAQVLSFDQLHKLNGSSGSMTLYSGEDAGASIKAAEDTAKRFNTVKNKVKTAAGELGQALKDAFSSGDFSRIGDLINGTLRKAADGFNSFVASIDAGKIGRTIGNLIQTLTNALLTLEEALDFRALAAKIGEGLKAMLDAVDWQSVGTALMNGFMVPFQMLDELLGTDGLFESIGKAIHDGLQGAIEAFDPAAVAGTISKAVNGIATIFISVFGDFEMWAEAATKLAETVNRIFADIDGSKVGQAISSFVGAILTTLTTFIEEADWEQIGRTIGETLAGIDWLGVAGMIVEAFGAAIGAMVGALSGFLEGTLEKALDALADGLREHIDAAGGNIVIGLLTAIRDAFLGIGDAMYEHIIDPLWTGITKALKFDFSFGGNANASIKGLAGGGVVSSGQLFMARENGMPELVGAMGSNTAVMNNDQIVSAVSSGVASAVASVLGSGADTAGAPTPVFLDGEQICTILDRSRRRRGVRNNPELAWG